MGELREAIRASLERHISESGYSQKEIAEKLGVSKSSVTNWIKGKNSPDVELVIPICRLLNISVREFYGEPDTETPSHTKKSPAPAEASTREISLEESNNLLIALGYIKPGEQISDDDLAFLEHVIGLLVVPPHFERYLEVSGAVRDIYVSYTDQVEPFGLDECWLDVGGSEGLFGPGEAIANDIRGRIKREVGVTASVGVSFNKVFAKLGSDYKKPDATTVITRDNYRDVVWTLPVSDLLYVGPATTKKLARFGIKTIGDLARTGIELLHTTLGKVGVLLWQFANGLDSSGVSPYYAMPPVKTIGNSTTAPRDLVTDDDVKITLYALSESVAARLREQRSVCGTVQIGIRDTALLWYERQQKLYTPTCNSTVIADTAFRLFSENRPPRPVRSLSVRASGLALEDESPQLSFFPEDAKLLRRTDLERTMDHIRAKYGYSSIRRSIQLLHPELDLDAKGDHIIHPVGFLSTLS